MGKKHKGNLGGRDAGRLAAETVAFPNCPSAPVPALGDRRPTLPPKRSGARGRFAFFGRLMAKPLIIAHRGASAEFPENTLPAFRGAIAAKVDAIEVDVRVTADGVPVVFHDELLYRLTGADGSVADTAWADMGHLRVFDREPIPRLVEALKATKRKTVMHIEIKPGVPVAPVVDAVRAARAAEWVILGSFSLPTVQEARVLAPELPRMLISEGRQSPRVLLAELLACDACGLSVNHRAVEGEAWLQWFHARGYSVWAWTVNDARAARRLAGWGIDGLMGDNPALLRGDL